MITHSRLLLALLCGATLLLGAACSSSTPNAVDTQDASADVSNPQGVDSSANVDVETSAVARTVVVWDDNGAFFDRPWPELSRLTADGTPALTGFLNPETDGSCSAPQNQLLATVGALIKKRDYRNYLIDFVRKQIKGFGTNTPLYVRFSAAIDPSGLPSPQTSMTAEATVQLVNVTPGSPRIGQRIPLMTKLLDASPYVATNVLGVLPYPGFPLAPGERYALVVLRSLRDAGGDELGVTPTFSNLLVPGSNGLRGETYREALTQLNAAGIPSERIAVASVFKTGDPAAPVRKMTPVVEAISPSHLAVAIDQVLERPTFYRVSGTLNVPFFQKGDPPYLPPIDVAKFSIDWSPDDDTGRLITEQPFDPNNNDLSAPRLDRIRFAISVPKSAVANLKDGEMTAPLPFAVYGHGTGGSRYTFINNGVAAIWADLGIAGVSINAVVHQERSKFDTIPADLLKLITDLGFLDTLKKYVEGGNLGFNVLNLSALAGNIQQSALDYAWLAHAFRETQLQVTLGGTAVTLRFSPDRVFYTGHSQGAITGPLTVFSTALKAYFFSAGAGHMTLWALTKTAVEDGLTVKELAQFIICDDARELDLFHPILALYQLVSEPIDQMNFDPYLFQRPLAQRKHVMSLLGIGDNWTPSASVGDATTTAMRLTHVGPQREVLQGQILLGQSVFDADLSGNYVFDGSPFTAGLKQYTCDTFCDEGHFVLFYVPEAQDDFKTYFQTLLSDDAPTIPY